MANQAIKTLGLWRKFSDIDKGLGKKLPDAYEKFYKEWKLTEPSAVHFIEEKRKWKRDEVTGEVKVLQNYPIELRFPPEQDEHLWGGEGVIQGFEKRSRFKRRVPHFWVPHLTRSVVHTEVLNKYMSVVVTPRTLDLIHENYGFDHYLLKTLACDLRSLLAVQLKRKILQDLSKGCPAYKSEPEKQEEIYNRYKSYLAAYTQEEINWYGYSFEDACKKYEAIEAAKHVVVPLKHVYRAQLIQELKEPEEQGKFETESSSWIQKINPFAKKPETS